MATLKKMQNLTRRQQEVLKFVTRYHRKKGYAPSIRDICKGVKLSSSSTVHLHLKSLEEKGFIRRDPTKPRTIEILEKAEEVLGITEVSRPEAKSESMELPDVTSIRVEAEEKELPEPPEEEYVSVVGMPEPEQFEIPESFQPLGAIEELPAYEVDEEISAPGILGMYKFVECPLLKGYDPSIPILDPDNIEAIYPLPEMIAGRDDAILLRMSNDSMTGAGILPGDLCILHPAQDFTDGDIAAVVTGGSLTIKRIRRYMSAYMLEPENRRMKPVFVKEIAILGILKGVIRVAG